MPSTNDQIASLFDDMATLLQMKGDSVFKVRAYQRAARTVEQLPMSLEKAVHDGEDLKAIPGIGDAISKKIREMVTTGRVDAYERLKGELPRGSLTFMNIPGVGPKTAVLIARETGAGTVEELERAILQGRLADVPRMGEKTAQNILRHVRRLRSKKSRVPIGVALPVAEGIITQLRQAHPGLGRVSPAGSLRRSKETVGDIDIMGTSDDPGAVMDALVGLPQVQEVLGHGSKKSSVVIQSGLQIDLRIVAADSWGAMLQYFTGSQQHSILLRDYANQQGLSLNEYGISDLESGALEKQADEESFYRRLGLPLIPPEIREGMWELDLAREGRLPRLVELSDLRGDLHVHSNWTDGADSLEAMVQAAAALGFEYVAITDRSMGRGTSAGLSSERLLEQLRVLGSIQERCGVRVLTGCEVEIHPEGFLDHPDDILQRLDVVVASVHSALGQHPVEMTRRIVKAMDNPNVDIVGHPTCRIVGSRESEGVDVEALFAAAAATGTAMEINGSPDRLDLKDSHILRAVELGVPLAIGSDAHGVSDLDHTRFGVAMARRGWCESRHILNTLPLPDLLTYLDTPKPHRRSLLAGRG
jgi:DNA polymerase (family 10)